MTEKQLDVMSRLELRAVIAQQHEQLSEVREASDQHRKDLNTTRVQLGEKLKQLDLANTEISSLKDELHRMTIENARLEGYRDRVLEFDPVTERQEYRDQTGATINHDQHFGTPPDRVLRRSQGAHGLDRVYDFSDRVGGERPRPWYRRG